MKALNSNEDSRNKPNEPMHQMEFKCYLTGETLTDSNSSVEHVIPNALGGKLKSPRIMVKDWNSKLGRTVDAALCNSIPIHTIFNLKRDRGSSPNVNTVDQDGNPYLLKRNGKAERKPVEPLKRIADDGQEEIGFIKSQEDSIIKKILRTNPDLSEEEVRKNIVYDEPFGDRILFFDQHLSIVSGAIRFRAICKIAANFYVFSRKEVLYVQPVKEFILGKDDENYCVHYYYPENSVYIPGNGELSHVLYLVGDYSEQILYCYIELYNLHNLIVVLNSKYDGPSFKNTYIYDLRAAKELKKSIDLKLSRKDILDFTTPFPPDVEKKYFDKLIELGAKNNMKFSAEKIKSD